MNSWKLNGIAGHITRSAICKGLNIPYKDIYKTIKSIEQDNIIVTKEGKRYEIVCVPEGYVFEKSLRKIINEDLTLEKLQNFLTNYNENYKLNSINIVYNCSEEDFLHFHNAVNLIPPISKIISNYSFPLACYDGDNIKENLKGWQYVVYKYNEHIIILTDKPL